jgi:hypothetical protein
MGVVPTKPVQKIQYFSDHIAPFTENAVAIGVTTTEVTDLGTKAAAARAAYDAQQAARQAAKAATEAFENAVVVMGVAGAALLKKIRAKAEQTGNPNVYTMAQIPAPPTPSAKPAPGKPTDLKVELDGNGALVLKFKCPNPAGASGTMYQIWRAVGAGTDFAYLGGTGQRKYVDTSVPAGATRLTYQIQAVRSTAVGMWATFVVNFGTNAGGVATASVSEPAPAKLAA